MRDIRGQRRRNSESRGRVGPFTQAGGLIRSVLANLGLEAGLRQYEAVAAWAEIVGEKIAAATEARGISDGVLQVACRSNVWANELMMLKPRLIEKLSERVGRNVVKDIRFSAARLPKKAAAESDKQVATAHSPNSAAQAEADAVAKAVSELVTDGALAAAVNKAVRTAVLTDAEKLALGWKRCRKCGAPHNEEGKLCAVCRVQ